MEHRDVPGTFWPGHDQNLSCNNGMQQHMQFGYVGSSDTNRVAYPVDNRPISQGQVHHNWSNSSVSVGYAYTHQNNGFQRHQNDEPPHYHPYPPLATVPAIPGGHVYPLSSSNFVPPEFYQNRPSYEALRMDGRESSKRKSFAVPFGGEDLRFTGAGSSSSGHRHPKILQEKSHLDCARHWEHHAMRPSSSLSGSRPVRDEGAMRNVRTRYAYDVESGLIPSGVSVPFERPAIHLIGHSGSLDSSHWSSSGVNPSWRQHAHMPYAAPGMMPVADLSNSNQRGNHMLPGTATSMVPYEARRYQNHLLGASSPFDQHIFYETVLRPMQEAHSFPQQCSETFRNTHTASGAGPSHCPQIVSENYSSTRHAMSFQGDIFARTSWNGGPRISQERHIFLPSDIRGPGSREGFFIWGRDQSAIEGFQDMFDQHSDMRLDVDNMSYEELLALGDRIGNVSTGLSDDAASKCLMEILHHSSIGHVHDEESCSICLEEYTEGDIVGKLRGCAHSYHSSCIKNWLSMKNSCPICKAPGIASENIRQGDKPKFA